MKEQRRLPKKINIIGQRKLLLTQGGSNNIARKREEMEREYGHKVSRGKVWIATHKKTNGAFVNDEGRKIGEKIEAYESTLSSSQSQEISTSDSLVVALGIKEHCGRIRGLGLGPCPSKVFGVHASSYRGSSSASASNVVELQTQVSSLSTQVNEMKTMISLLLQNYPGQLLHSLLLHFNHWYLIKEVCHMMDVTKKNLRHHKHCKADLY